MSYRCLVCRDTTPHGHPLLKRILYRSNGQIEKEIPVCNDCNNKLSEGKAQLEIAPVHAPPDFSKMPPPIIMGKPVLVGKKAGERKSVKAEA